MPQIAAHPLKASAHEAADPFGRYVQAVWAQATCHTQEKQPNWRPTYLWYGGALEESNRENKNRTMKTSQHYEWRNGIWFTNIKREFTNKEMNHSSWSTFFSSKWWARKQQYQSGEILFNSASHWQKAFFRLRCLQCVGGKMAQNRCSGVQQQ